MEIPDGLRSESGQESQTSEEVKLNEGIVASELSLDAVGVKLNVYTSPKFKDGDCETIFIWPGLGAAGSDDPGARKLANLLDDGSGHEESGVRIVYIDTGSYNPLDDKCTEPMEDYAQKVMGHMRDALWPNNNSSVEGEERNYPWVTHVGHSIGAVMAVHALENNLNKEGGGDRLVSVAGALFPESKKTGLSRRIEQSLIAGQLGIEGVQAAIDNPDQKSGPSIRRLVGKITLGIVRAAGSLTTAGKARGLEKVFNELSGGVDPSLIADKGIRSCAIIAGTEDSVAQPKFAAGLIMGVRRKLDRGSDRQKSMRISNYAIPRDHGPFSDDIVIKAVSMALMGEEASPS